MRGFFMAKSIIKVVYLKWFGKGLATLIKKVCNILLTIQLQTFKVPGAGVEPARFPTGV